MGNLFEQRFDSLGRRGKTGLLYTLVGLAGLITILVREGIQRPFGIFIWVMIIGWGLYYLIVVGGRK